MAENESEKKGPKFLRKAERDICKKAKDQYWDCMKADKVDLGRCVELRKEFESLCPPTWVTHFDENRGRRSYEKFKRKMAEAGWQKPDGQ